MALGTVLWALFGALCWGLAPIFGKLGLGAVDPAAGLYLRTLTASSLVLIWLAVSDGWSHLDGIPPAAWLFVALEAILATLVGDLAYYAALKGGSASQVTLIMASAPVFTLWAGYAFLGERLTWQQALGAALMIGGLLLIGGSTGAARG